MAITQISRIQHRRGLKAQLPQLSAGEFGFAVDTQELFIGNGTVQEGAPEVGNTKILTEDDNILSVANTYTLKGNTDNPVVTGVDNNAPIVRTLQQKLDDRVSVKDFGAVGDGIVDDTAAINRAIKNTYTVDTGGKERRTLYFPGGTYLVAGSSIKLFPHATILGDGPTSTFIKSNDSSLEFVVETVDRLGQTDANIGNGGAEVPNGIRVQGMCFQTVFDRSIMKITQAIDIHFDNCHWLGSGDDSFQNQDGVTNNNATVKMFSTTANPCKRISFNSCTFEGIQYGFDVSDDVEDVNITASEFLRMHRALNLGEASDGSTANKTVGPTGFTVMGSRFDLIDVEAVRIYSSGGNPTGNVIAGNNFRSVAKNADDSSDGPSLIFSNGHNFAYGNFFHRGGTTSEFGGNLYHESAVQLTVTLDDNTSTATDVTDSAGTVVEHDVHRVNHFEYHYIIARDTARRTGCITVSGTSANISFTDDFTENTDVGVVFTVTSSGVLQYTTTSTGTAATMKYRVASFV